MATLDLSKAKTAVDMTDPDLVRFGVAVGVGTSTIWTYLTPGGDKVVARGQNLQFDASGRAIGGTVTSLEYDLGNDGAGPDMAITGVSLAAAQLHNVPELFWRFLEGADVILGPERANGAPTTTFQMFGDGPAARPGGDVGGRDVIHTGDGWVLADGDVENVGSPTVGAPTSQYRGGDDEILGLVGDRPQGISGDVSNVYRGSRLDGGDDSILIQSTSASASAAGDAYDVGGHVVGGDDYIAAGKDFQGRLAGDVFEAHPQSLVEGGDDRIIGGDLGDYIAGDVYKLRGGRLVGGDDRIEGRGGNDIIAGDAYDVRTDSTVAGGDDLIYGGGSNDEVYGDAGYGPPGVIVVGGDDRIYGDDGNDRLHGEGGADTIDGGTQSDRIYGGDGNDWLSGGADNDTIYGDAGNDMLDGGRGADVMVGLTGDDTYFVNDAGDVVSELAGFGIDTVWTTLGAGAPLAANVENLRFNGVGNFLGVGNGLDNTIAGGALEDRLEGGDGADVLDGGGGGDLLYGGAGVDTASYASASGRVDASLMFPAQTGSGDARGDFYFDIENLTGSAFDDVLIGDDQANTLAGGGGADLLLGEGGGDVVIGGGGSDSVAGMFGADLLRGGRGADILVGGQGDDVFDFNSVADSGPGARDRIVADEDGTIAFEGAGVAGGDVIDLSDIDANTSAGGNQTFVFGGTGRGRVSVVDVGGNSLVRANTDGDTAFEFELLIEDAGVLASSYRAGDFML